MRRKGKKAWQRSTLQALHYSASSFSVSVLNNVFICYYVEMFMIASKLSNTWFMAGQLLYCVWNCVNDPIFGWFGDTTFSGGHRRLPRLKLGGPLWCLAFLFTWFPWTNAGKSSILAGAHFLCSMILYDGALSFTMIAHQALLTDMTSDDKQREKCNLYSAVAHLIGSFAVFAAHQVWDPLNLQPFQILCVVLASLAFVGFMVTANSPYVTEEYGLSGLSHSASCTAPPPPAPSLGRVVRGILQHHNFCIFVVVGLFQQFSCTFNTNFFAIFLDAITSKSTPRYQQSLLLLSSFVLPHIGTILLTSFIHKHGKYNIVKVLFSLRLVASVLCLYLCCNALHVPVTKLLVLTPTSTTAALDAPPRHQQEFAVLPEFGHNSSRDFTETVVYISTCITTFLVVNRILTECVCRLIPLIISDLVDEDFVKNNRKVTLSSTYFGCHALLTKPGQSLAPMFGWWILSRQGFRQYQQEELRSTLTAVVATHTDVQRQGEHVDTSAQSLWFTLLQLIFLTPVVMTVLMLVVWRSYSLCGRHLQQIKTALHKNLLECLV